jgi:nucleoside 2-deoxyribosyltransferase
MSKVEIGLGNLVNSCFVIMPFSAVFDAEYAHVIRPAIEATGLSSIRADQIYSKPQIMADIWKSLRSSRIIIAELSDKNVNVFYELGLAHALGKPVIIVTRNEQDVPFDLKALRYLYYDTNNPSWGESLKNDLTEMISSLLKEKEFGTVFERITTIITTEYKENKAEKTTSVSSLPCLAGVWDGQMQIPESYFLDLKLQLKQTESELEGTLTVCANYPDYPIIQESIKGILLRDKVTLYGVSYTFIRKGTSKDYSLDSFQGKLSDNGNEISGACTDTTGKTGEFSLKR